MSMFSQSLAIGDDTFGELEKPEINARRPPESLEIIDESPTSTLASRTNRSGRLTSMRTQTRSARTQRVGAFKRNKSDSVLLNPPGTSAGGAIRSTNESYSDLFGSDLECAEFDAKKNYEGYTGKGNSNKSLENYFKDSIEFSCGGSSQINNPKLKTEDVELGNMFENSNFFSQPVDTAGTDEILLDVAIVTDENTDIAWFAELNTKLQDPVARRSSTIHAATEAILWQDCSFEMGTSKINQPRNELTLAQNVCWEDSGDFNQGIIDVEQSDSHQTVKDEAVVCIENVTFTQDFLNSSVQVELKHSPGTNQSLTSDFIHNEMVKCQKQVSLGLAENSQLLGDSLVNLDISCTSNMVLNYSADSIPINRSTNPKPIKESLQEIQTSIPTTIQRELPKQANLNQIDQWGLLPAIVREYHRKGIRTMFDWQVECLSNTKVNI